MASSVPSTPLAFIAPRRSATTMNDLPPRTHWSYVKDRNGMSMTEPVVGYYFNPPAGAKCRWSTDNGRREPQHLQFGAELPRRALILWDDAKLDGEASYYRQKHWEDMKTLVAPQRFEDLYEFFDSATIWTHGATNLWNLINLLVADAHTNWREHERRVATECNDWILDWLENFPSAQFNRDNLMRWNQQTDILTAVLTHYDWMNDLKDLDMVGQNIMRECMLYHYKRLTGNEPPVACFNHRATDPAPAPALVPVTLSTDVAPDDLPNSQHSSKIGSPPPQGLATIPEHTSPAKASAKTIRLTIDTTASIKVPKHTVSAPATAVPHITVTPQIPPQAEESLVHKDGNDSTNDEFFNPQLLATQIEVKARQLSTHSAPDEEFESKLSAGRSHSQPRASSTTLQPSVLQRKDTPSRHTVPERPNAIASALKANHNINTLPSRAARNSPPRGPQLRRHAVATVPTYQPLQHPMVQQGAPLGPPPQPQHMMPPCGAQNGMLQQPPVGFMAPAPPHGMPPHHNAFAAQGPAPPDVLTPQGPAPPGLGMPPMVPPVAPFQNQYPMHQPHTDMSSFGNPQEHPMNAPSIPQYTAQPNVAIPMYQPNGYIYQPHDQHQHQPGAFNGNRQFSQKSRRGSMNSNTSRKLRDDPIHGPVYAMNPRKSSNASTGRVTRKPSNSNPEQTFQGPRAPCANAHIDRTSPDEYTYARFAQLYEECPCPRCADASRSVFVKHHDASLAEYKVREILMRYFAAWNPVRVKPWSQKTAAMVLFQNDHDAVSAIQSFWSTGDKHKIPGLGKNTSIWYPMFSRHYSQMGPTSTGAPRGLLEAQNTSRRLSNSSMPRRGSNPYLGQRPVFNNPNFGNGAPGPQQQQQQMAGQPNINNTQPGTIYPVPYQPQPPQASQRELWVPPANDSRRKSSTAVPTKENKAVSPKTHPEDQAEELLEKEDWRSKPPSEEAIEDLGDEVAVVDTASNISSQGARSIAVRLPTETEPASSRTISPEVEDSPSQEQTKEEQPKVEEPREKPKTDDAPTSSEPAPTKGGDEKSSSSYNMATSELAVPVEELQPIVASKHAHATEQHGQKTAHSYSKVTSELTGPTETIDLNTVIRHKPQKPRNRLPIEWANNPDGERSELQSRFADLQDEFQNDIQNGSASAPPTEEAGGTDAVTAPEAPEELTTQQEPKAKQSKTKRGKNKKKQAQADTNATASGPSCDTPADVQSRVPSRASTSRPASRASTKRPQSAASTTAEPSRPSSAMQVHAEDQAPVADDGATQPKKKWTTKSQKKRKQALAAEAAANSEGQAKTGGSQDQDQGQGRAVSGQESPKKKPKTLHPGPEPGTVEKSSASDPAAGETTADDPQKKIDEQQAASKDAGYRTDAGGSLRMKKNRSPTKVQQQSHDKDGAKTPSKQESNPLQTIFEPPSEAERKDVSPDANLFPGQKFAIDQAKASAPPKMHLGKKENVKPSGKTIKLTANNARIGSLPPGFNPYPQLPPNTKPSAWSTVVKRGLNEDPFRSGNEVEDQSKNWMNDKAVKSPEKPRGDDGTANTSPTPSPEKKSGHRGGKSNNKSQLSATAKAFTPLTSPCMSAASLRTTETATVQATAAVPAGGATPTTAPSGLEDGRPIPHRHHAKKPSLPGQKGSGIDARLITPAEQTVDSAKVEQPGPPTKEKKKQRAGGPAPVRGGGGGGNNSVQQQQQQQKRISAQVASSSLAAETAPAMGSQKDFPALAAAAAVTGPKDRAASFAQAASGSKAPPPVASTSSSSSASASSAPRKENAKVTASSAAPATSPNDIKLGQRGGVSGAGAGAGPAAPAAPAGKDGLEVPEGDDWTTVGPGKKITGGKSTATGRAASGGRASKSAQQSSRGDGGGGGGGRVPTGEERKGG